MKVTSLLKRVCALRYRIYRLWWRCQFQSFGCKSTIISSMSIDGPENIRIGNHVFVAYKTWLAALPHTGESTCLLELQDGVTIGHFNHIYATKKIIIKKTYWLSIESIFSIIFMGVKIYSFQSRIN